MNKRDNFPGKREWIKWVLVLLMLLLLAFLVPSPAMMESLFPAGGGWII